MFRDAGDGSDNEYVESVHVSLNEQTQFPLKLLYFFSGIVLLALLLGLFLQTSVQYAMFSVGFFAVFFFVWLWAVFEFDIAERLKISASKVVDLTALAVSLKNIWSVIKSKWASNWKHLYLPYILFTVIITLYHVLINPNFGDDGYFSTVLSNSGLFEFIGHRYDTWSSRWFIESVLIFVSQHIWLWKILDIIAFVVIAITLSYLTNNIKIGNYFVVSLVLLYPIFEMSTAGWMATTLNYLWPLATLLLACIPIKKYLDAKKLKWNDYLLFFLPLLFITNVEQGAGIVCILLLFAIAYLKTTHKIIPKFLFVGLVADIASLLFMLTCPGNANRISSEIQHWLPTFVDWSFFDKVFAGLTIIERELFANLNFVYLTFCILLLLGVIICRKKILSVVISCIPCLIWFGYLIPTFSNIYVALTSSLKVLCILQILPFSEFISGIVSMSGNSIAYVATLVRAITPISFTHVDYSLSHVWIPVILLVIACVCNLCSLYTICGGINKHLIFSIVVLFAGFSSYLVLCLSPTIYATGNRAAIYLYFSLIFVACYIYALKYSGLYKQRVIFLSLWMPVILMCLYSVWITLQALM